MGHFKGEFGQSYERSAWNVQKKLAVVRVPTDNQSEAMHNNNRRCQSSDNGIPFHTTAPEVEHIHMAWAKNQCKSALPASVSSTFHTLCPSQSHWINEMPDPENHLHLASADKWCFIYGHR